MILNGKGSSYCCGLHGLISFLFFFDCSIQYYYNYYCYYYHYYYYYYYYTVNY